MPDADKALGQAVKQKPPDELDGSDRERLGLLFLSVSKGERYHARL